LLDAEGEKKLAEKIAKGDNPARQRLVEANLRLVVKIARAYPTNEMSLMDLIQEGNIGLIKAAGKFDGNRNVRFSTYAAWWIKQSISRALVNTGRAIRLPHRKEELLRHVHVAANILGQTLRRVPTAEELARELDVKTEEVGEILSISGSLVPLESETEDETGSVLDTYADYTFSPEREYDRKAIHETTRELLASLQENEKRILSARFELFGQEHRTLKTLGFDLGLSPETIRQVEKRAIRKLRDTVSTREYDFLLERPAV
jgi:RNA polymerase primary sigma factor